MCSLTACPTSLCCFVSTRRTYPETPPSGADGHALNDDGLITAAKIEARDAGGAATARTEISGDSVSTLTIPPGSRHPLVLIAYPEGGAEPVKAAVSDAAVREQEISAVTTIVVDTALSLGGSKTLGHGLTGRTAGQ